MATAAVGTKRPFAVTEDLPPSLETPYAVFRRMPNNFTARTEQSCMVSTRRRLSLVIDKVDR
jgi:hypothetical protein